MEPIRIFTSSVQKELAEERAALRDYLQGDALLRRFFEVFLFETKYIERMGTGIRDMIQRCRDAGLPEPEIRLDSGVWVTTIRRKTPQVTDQDTPQVTPQDNSLSSSILQDIARILGVSTPQVTPQVVEQVISVLNAAENPASGAELQRAAGLIDRVYFLKRYLEPLLAESVIERTIPDKPTSRLQKYRITDKGKALRQQMQ